MGKRLLFLADVHLHPRNPQRTELLFAFLGRQRRDAEAIYILGDLLDFWVGAKQLRRPEWARFLERLGEVTRGGPPIRILGGNRDYLLDKPSLEPYGLESLGREHTFDADGHRITLVHGDKHFPDRFYSRAFLWLINRPAACTLARHLPLPLMLTVARAMRGWRQLVSRSWDPKAARRYDPKRFLPLFDKGADTVICGHNHWAKDYTAQLARPACRLLALGEWVDAPSYLEYANGTFRLVDPRLNPDRPQNS